MLIKKITIKSWQYIKSRGRLRKIKEGADFHKKCEYCQTDIQLLFDNGVFDLRNGSAILHKDGDGRIREIKFDHKVWKG